MRCRRWRWTAQGETTPGRRLQGARWAGSRERLVWQGDEREWKTATTGGNNRSLTQPASQGPPAAAMPRESSTVAVASPASRALIAATALCAVAAAAACASGVEATAPSWRTALSRPVVLPAAMAVPRESPIPLISAAVGTAAAAVTATVAVEQAWAPVGSAQGGRVGAGGATQWGQLGGMQAGLITAALLLHSPLFACPPRPPRAQTNSVWPPAPSTRGAKEKAGSAAPRTWNSLRPPGSRSPKS